MKRRLFLFLNLTALLLMVGFTGCDDDDSEGGAQTVVVTNDVGEVVVVEVPVDDNDGGTGNSGTPTSGNTDGGSGAVEDVPVAERPALEAPSPISPPNPTAVQIEAGSSTADVTFSWTGVDNALYYFLQVSTSGGSREAQVTGTSHTLSLPEGLWHWQVAAVNGELIEWSDTSTLSIAGAGGGWIPTDP